MRGGVGAAVGDALTVAVLVGTAAYVAYGVAQGLTWLPWLLGAM